jgi:hypothetical protein
MEDDVIRAVRALQRNGLPVPMSNEAALTFISGWLAQNALWEENAVGAHNRTARYVPPPSPEDMDEMIERTTKAVCRIFRQVCEELDDESP